eukprot:XP_019081064.1 PREDICTED: golgin candidate 4 isoform X2 [Vitis vinifera]
MWSTIANLKENLNKIALDVHDDDDEELQIHAPVVAAEDPSVSDRRFSHKYAHSNGIDSAYNSEIEQYKAEIKRLQESEAEIKALSINYAALLKDKEDQISKLSKENGSLKHNLDSTNAVLSASRSENSRTSTNSLHALKGSGDQSPSRQHKLTAQVKGRSTGNQMHNGVVKQDGLSNGIAHAVQPDAAQSKMETKNSNLKGNEKTSMEMNKIRSELNEKRSVIQRLQMELNRREEEEANDMVESLKGVIANLEKENSCLKREKDEMEVALRMSKKASTDKISPDVSDASEKHFSSLNEVNSSGSFPGKEEMQISLQQVERDLKEACQERDKALQELTRLKQHLLEKESEESEKMDEDSKIIEELRQNNEYQRAQILNLEKALKQAIARQDEIKMLNSSELQKSKEIIDDLNKKLASYMCTLDAKNVELLNLQTALGQYYAEMEAKERLERDLAHAREESAKLSELLKDASQQAELSKREKEEILAKLSQAETMLGEGKSRVNKLEEDNMKLRRALEQSMIRLNRMSMDSDYFVDRRIVVKLLVTYFQRNHSKEVLDLMVRMLGFSDEDKQRIGVAQQGTGKGVVRGVLGLPGRLVGGILGGSSGEAQANVASENQSFADLWVDFLLKETEERERREAVDVTGAPKGDPHRSPNFPGSSPMPDRVGAASGFSRLNPAVNPNPSSMFSHGSVLQSEASDSEFSNVPLTSAESSSRLSRLLPKY